MNTPIPKNLFPATSTAFLFLFTDEQDRILGVDRTKLPVETYAATGVYTIKGQGLADFANIIANSKGFYRCMVKRIISQLYLKMHFNLNTMPEEAQEVLRSQENTIETFATILMNNQDLADIYRRIAVWYLFRK